jgi:hypothetical protein
MVAILALRSRDVSLGGLCVPDANLIGGEKVEAVF